MPALQPAFSRSGSVAAAGSGAEKLQLRRVESTRWRRPGDGPGGPHVVAGGPAGVPRPNRFPSG